MPDIIVAGSFVQDLTFNTNAFPKVGETRIGTFNLGPGGKGFNQAIACARLKADTLFIGALGDDSFALTAEQFSESEGLATAFQRIPGISSGAAAIMIDATGDNQIIVALGANGELQADWVDAQKSAFAGAKVVLCQLEANLDAMAQTLKLGAEAGAATILNLAPINEGFTPSLLQNANIVTPNETEFSFLYHRLTGETLPPDYFKASDGDLHAMCRELGVPVTIITLGDEGCFVSVANGALPGGLSFAGGDCRRYAPIKVKPVDTTGAGDAFNGGLAAGLTQFGGDLDQAIRYANIVAGLSVEKPGTAPSMPSKEAVDQRAMILQNS